MPSEVAFHPASRQSVKARIALAGPSGSGKTYTGLVLASALAAGGSVAVIDTEKGSASLYADEFKFDTLELDPPFDPARYVAAIHAAEQAGYAVILIDSLSHAWSDEGGVLDIVDKEAERSRGNKFAAWRKGTPAHNSLVGAIVRSSAHVVATMRTKTAYAVEESGGRTSVRKIGLEPIQREGIDYEFTVFGEINLSHTLVITKSRFKDLQDAVIAKPGPELGAGILAELGKEAVQDGAKAEAVHVAERRQPGSTERAADDSSDLPDPDVATPDQIKALQTLASKLGWSQEERHELAGVVSFKDLSKERAGELIEDWSDQANNRSRGSSADRAVKASHPDSPEQSVSVATEGSLPTEQTARTEHPEASAPAATSSVGVGVPPGAGPSGAEATDVGDAPASDHEIPPEPAPTIPSGGEETVRPAPAVEATHGSPPGTSFDPEAKPTDEHWKRVLAVTHCPNHMAVGKLFSATFGEKRSASQLRAGDLQRLMDHVLHGQGVLA